MSLTAQDWKRRALRAALEAGAAVAGAAVAAALAALVAVAAVLGARYALVPANAGGATRPLHFDYTAAEPVAVAPFLPESMLSADGASVAGSAPPGAAWLPRNVPYAVTVRLALPQSPDNAALGVFAVTGEVLTAAGNATLTATRPCALVHRSYAVRAARTLAVLPLLATGLVLEEEEASITLFDGVMDNPLAPFAQLRVTLAAAPSKGRSVVPQVTRATAAVELQLTGLRYLLHRFSGTTSIVGFALVFGWIFSLCVVALVTVRLTVLRDATEVALSDLAKELAGDDELNDGPAALGDGFEGGASGVFGDNFLGPAVVEDVGEAAAPGGLRRRVVPAD